MLTIDRNHILRIINHEYNTHHPVSHQNFNTHSNVGNIVEGICQGIEQYFHKLDPAVVLDAMIRQMPSDMIEAIGVRFMLEYDRRRKLGI